MSAPDPPNVWSRIYSDVKIQIPGVTDAVFKQMLYQVVNDFLDRTNAWYEEVPIAVSPASRTYPFTLTEGASNRLMMLYDPLDASPDKHWVQGGVQLTNPYVIELRYAPSSAVTWNAMIAKTLDTVGSEGYPDFNTGAWIIDKYGDGIHYGILGRLQMMPGKPYSNAKLGASNWQVYVTERGQARTDVLHSNVYGGQRWMFPQSFATVRRGGWA